MSPPQQKAPLVLASAVRVCPRTFSCPFLSGVVVALVLAIAAPGRAQTHSDKLLHAGASAAVVDVAWAGCALLDQPLWVRLVVGVGAGAVVGLAKEGVDLAGFGTPDAADLLFDGFGIGLGVAVALLVETALAQGPDDDEIQPRRVDPPRS